jgi:cytochrome P450
VRIGRGVAASALSARAFFQDPVGYVRKHAEGAETVSLRAGPRRFFLVRDPEAVWDVLVRNAESFRPGKWKHRARRFLGDTLNTLDGNEHRRRRLLVQPALDRRRIATFAPSIARRAEQAQAEWSHGTSIRLRTTLDRLSLTAAGDALLSTDLDPISSELADALASMMAALPKLTPPVHGTAGARALARVDRVVHDLIAGRRATPRDNDDLLGTLLAAELPDSVVRGEVIAFLLAAVDEPPSALEAAWYLLARNPDAEERLHSELDTVLGNDLPTRYDEPRLPYLRAVLRETLRLFPPARHIDRCPVHDVRIGRAHIRTGSNVLISPLVTHHDRHLYERASEFVPERWLDGGAGSRNGARGAYLPFGAGPHTCIGEPLAWSIMTLTLATIARRWRLRVAADAAPPTPRSPRLVVTLERR